MRIEPIKDTSALVEATKACRRVIAIQNQAGIEATDTYVSGEQVLKIISQAEEEHLRQIEKLNEIIAALNDLTDKFESLKR